ncbi:amino acid permease/ SLC12A domain-containing protein [Aspergillus pseudonomiae]|uniref:Amino acid permease/ SLC12A domain-containing protein n=1 Tax=Aspergillus pseudonomiae TaxID=1506151 RepID=A0A5N6I7N9_9EURO|nr:amino acid permease/ SLC12A domain-containing protein [Aspergillus pseudonomiae]KAB8262606.1 amino acid permease/ SLC12A domain-containing protein [Aspergillus pseudonomiae]KAE8398454.1 amino acid permease/ SLC12A domain-containing protein [Aspergillus pseudonomiae]
MPTESGSGIQLAEGDGSSATDGDIGFIRRGFGEVHAVRQGLYQRHLQMIALAGTIGTGLFLSSGQALVTAGPLGAFLAYSIVGLGVMSVVLTVGEMGALVPLSGGVVRYAEYFFDPAMAFANGWNQVYLYSVTLPAEIVAASVLIEFWIIINNAIWITVFSLLVLITALVFVRIYGELEFSFAILKILLIVGVNIMALVITCGGGPTGQSIGFRYWRDPGPFVQYFGIKGALGRFLGFWTTLENAIFAYSGIQNITIPAAETRYPRQSIPQATRRVLYRIILFYVLSIFMMGLVVPSNDPTLLQLTGTASQSPFVIAAHRAGIKVAPSVINAIIVTSAWSAGNSYILFGSRILYGMAVHGHAPAVFKRLNRFSVPYVAISFIGSFMCLGYMSLSHSATVVFQWLRDIVAVATLVDWLIVCIVYLRFYYGCKKQGVDRHRELPWAAPFQPYFTWASLTLFTLLLITGGFSTFISGHWDTETFISSYINIPIVLGLYLGYKFWRKTRIIALDTIPLVGLLQFYLSHEEVEPEPQPRKGLAKFNILW